MGITIFTSVLIAGCSGTPPTDLGLTEGSLKPCPDKPNCVVSQNSQDSHAIAPISYQDSREDAVKRIKEVVLSEKRVKLIEDMDNYLRVEFKTALFGFVDDVEFYFPEEKLVQVRSASRVGYSDMGVNRKRIERIRKRFNEIYEND